jgi:SNF2 family DNA or RNA helicase
MANIKIEYIPESRRILLTASESSVGWMNIRRVCRERTDEFEDIGPNQFSVPCWCFLTVRKAIGHHITASSLSYEVDEKIRALLQDANSHEQSFTETATPELTHEQLPKELLARGFKRLLTPEQMRNVNSLMRFSAGATFSVPGAGKTTEALAYFTLTSAPDSHLLVIAPKNAFAAWEEQLASCLPHFSGEIGRLTGGASSIAKLLEAPKKFLLITYQQVPTVIDLIGDFLTRKKTMLFLDESHRMKRGIDGVIGKAVLGLAHLPEKKLIMSGTPMPNSEDDLVPQFSFLYPEMNADKDNVIELVKRVSVRTTKAELGLPPITLVIRNIELTPSQRYLYTLLKSEVAREAAGLKLKDRAMLRRFGKSVLRLLQLVSNPMLLSKEKISHEGLLAEILSDEDSPKIAYVCNRARQLAMEGKKTLIWSAFVDNVELISERLSDLGADFIHGGVEAGSEEEDQTREHKIKRFHDVDSAMVLVANPAACSEGISLHTVCHHAIYLDRNFNAAQFLQSEDRIHRLGLLADQETIIEIVCCPDTVDEVVDSRLKSKVQKMAEVLDDPSLMYDPVVLDPDVTDLDEGDVQELLKYLTEAN